jgi:HSP20 family protein
MSLTRSNNDVFPAFSNMLENFFGRDMDDLFNRSWSNVGLSVPAVNIKETNDAYYLEVAAPGMKKEDFKVTLDNGLITISTEKQDHTEQNTKEGRYTKREFSYHSFRRSFSLPQTADHEHIEARYIDGMLLLTVPKKEEARRKEPRMIEIG